MTDALQPTLERVPTGVPGLDVILNGGLLRGGSYLIVGEPGTGKTILSNQIAFHHAANGGKTIYVSILTETHMRLLAHLRSFNFFDPAPIGERLLYFSGYSIVEQAGLRGLLDLLRREVRAHEATLLVIDGLALIESTVEDDISLKRFVHDLQAALELLNCTAVIQAQPHSETQSMSVQTMVDGVITLSDRLVGVYAVRELEVRKFRGSDYLRGRHQLEINQAGVVIHPRTEALLSRPPVDPTEHRVRRSFGIPRLDDMLLGGLMPGSTTVVIGPPGSGKTLLGMHLLSAGAQQGENGLYFGFYETPVRLIDKANNIGLQFGQFVAEGRIEVIWEPPLENLLDVLAERLLAAVGQREVKRLFIDGLGGFMDATIYPERMSRYMAALTNELRARGVTTIWSIGLPDLFAPEIKIPIEGTAEVVDNVILLRYVELRSQLYRLISLMKVRESAYDPAIREFKIGGQGIDVAPTFESAEAILTGVARAPRFESPASQPVKRNRRS